MYGDIWEACWRLLKWAVFVGLVIAFCVGLTVGGCVGKAGADEPHEALAEVNHTRAAKRLPPFVYDKGLTSAAMGCARFRANRLIKGHYKDFQALPVGTWADAAGCGAASDSWGWLTCCTYERYKYAGAAWCRGSDGRRYMHIFVRRK